MLVQFRSEPQLRRHAGAGSAAQGGTGFAHNFGSQWLQLLTVTTQPSFAKLQQPIKPASIALETNIL
jgi:hypothetical protein